MSVVIRLLGIVLLVVVAARLIRLRNSYFERNDVLARKAVKAKLPQWVQFSEFLIMMISIGLVCGAFFELLGYIHNHFHPASSYLSSGEITVRQSLFNLVRLFPPFIAALPIGMILANCISWTIPPIREAEDRIMAEGVPGYSWRELNFGLLKFALVAVPVAAVLWLIAMIEP